LTQAEKLELQALSKKMERDSDVINNWLDEFNITKHREAALVYFTEVLIGLGVDTGRL
jgi:hypothetical protein